MKTAIHWAKSMHKIEQTPEVVLNRILKRRERFQPFDSVDCRRTALLIVDLQNSFLGSVVTQPDTAKEIVSNVNALSGSLRTAGGLVIFLQHTIYRTCVAEQSHYYDNFVKPDEIERLIQRFTPGSKGHGLWQDLDVRSKDLKVNKTKFSALAPGSSELNSILSERDIESVIVTGLSTNICCESTARDAAMLNYKVLFVSDATATHTDAEHNATLVSLAYVFADVRSTSEMLGLIHESSRDLCP